jgi:hypothetical protein
VLLVAVGTVALAVGLFLGSRSGDRTTATTSPSPTVSPTPSADEEPTPSGGSSSSAEPTTAPSQGPPAPSEFGDGRHFVLAEEVETSGSADSLVADLGYFLTDDQANEAAAEAGLETPVPNGYYIVNDNPKLRTVPISPDATVRYIPSDPCCDLQPWDLQAWIDAVNGEVQTDMMGEMSTTWWWITVRAGQVVAIEQQYLP